MNTKPKTNWDLLHTIYTKLSAKGYSEEEIATIVSQMYLAIAEVIMVCCTDILTKQDEETLRTGSETDKKELVLRTLSTMEKDAVFGDRLYTVIEGSLSKFSKSLDL